MPVTQSGDKAPSPGLPLHLTRFVGRARELEDLSHLLLEARLVTLTGAGGSGKTRLAFEAANRMDGGFESVIWVDLAPILDQTLILPQVVLALKQSERPATSSLESIVGVLGERRLLMVLDNCEHLVDACAGIVEALLRECPRLSIVATSREALGVAGETAWLVPPLAPGEAVQLFTDRARAVQPGFSLTASNTSAVTEICRRLDGLPLAIELAAARVRVLQPEQIAQRLSDAFRLLSAGSRTALPRHRTLRGMIDWSFELLSDREQVLLRRLAVFAGGFSLEAVEAICTGAPITEEEVLDSITTLVDKSLVVLGAHDGEARYSLLGTIQQYGAEHLQAAGEGDLIRQRHAEFYLALAEHTAPRLFGGATDRRLVATLVMERGNLRAVADWAMENPARLEKALRLGIALHWFWFARGRFEEGRKRLSLALSIDANVAPGVRSWALMALGHLHIWQGNPGAGLSCMLEALVLQQDLDDPEGMVYALNGVGACIYLSGDPVRCVPYFAAALPIAKDLPNRVLHAIVLHYNGRAAKERGDYQLARSCFEEATRIGRSSNASPSIAHPLAMLGRLAYVQGHLDEAMACYHESLTLHQANEDGWGIVQCLEGIAYVAAERRMHQPAALLLGASEGIRLRMATPMLSTEVPKHEAVKRLVREGLGDDFESASAQGQALGRDEAVQLALELTRIAAPAEGVAAAPVASAVAASTVPHLQVRTLGPLQVSREGELIDPGAWGSARPRELLVFLLLHPAGCTKDQVGLAFWPEASAAQVRNSFHVTLHRLRKALGHPEWIITASERYRLDPAVSCEFDALEFEREVTQALRTPGPEAEQRLVAALARYGGDFLAAESAGDWHLEIRERLQRLYVDGLMALGAGLIDQGRLAEVADTCRRVLARDEMNEEAWRRLMLCHARSAERAQALRLYQQLVELLEREFETEPDPLTTALYEKIQSGDPV